MTFTTEEINVILTSLDFINFHSIQFKGFYKHMTEEVFNESVVLDIIYKINLGDTKI